MLFFGAWQSEELKLWNAPFQISCEQYRLPAGLLLSLDISMIKHLQFTSEGVFS